MDFDYDFTEVCSSGSHWQYSIIDTNNGLAPIRRRAIIWTNGIVYWNQYPSLGLNELTYFALMMPYGVDFGVNPLQHTMLAFLCWTIGSKVREILIKIHKCSFKMHFIKFAENAGHYYAGVNIFIYKQPKQSIQTIHPVWGKLVHFCKCTKVNPNTRKWTRILLVRIIASRMFIA